MSMEVSGGVELRDDIARMADLLRASGENGSRACSWILQNAAQPVLEQMLHNASTDPKRRTGTLLRSIKIGRVAVFVIFKVAVLLQAKFFIELFSRI